MPCPITVARYEPAYKRQWDDFIASSKNGVFLFLRDYMDYHADRFPDASLMFFDDRGNLLAVMPATPHGTTLSSHAGLTFGGIVTSADMRTRVMLDVFDAMKARLARDGVSRIVYKAIPHIYHRVPAEEDLYALYRMDARIVLREVTSSIYLPDRLRFSKGRRWSIKQARKHGLQLRTSDDFVTFMAIEEYVLGTKYDLRPVHSAAELQLLAGRFPGNIRLFAAYNGADMVAGVVMYESRCVAHAQYIAASDEGKRTGALDLILGYLIDEHYAAKRFFDFGISTQDCGRYLNVGLIENKEGFGARAVVHDRYEFDVAAD